MRTRDNRGAYSFCMCPGGQVVAGGQRGGDACVNGMSPYRRDGINANAALLVEVRPEGLYGAGRIPLSGFAFQRHYERLAHEAGGGGYRAPVQLVGISWQASPPQPWARSRPPSCPVIPWLTCPRSCPLCGCRHPGGHPAL